MAMADFGRATKNYMTKKQKEYYRAWAYFIGGIIIYAFAIFGLIVFVKKLL